MKVKIFTRPSTNTKVGHEYKIHGQCQGPVNIFVLSNDGQYYLQTPVERHGHHFSVQCKLGFPEVTLDSGYEIIAVATDQRPHSPVKELPEGEKDAIRVWRDQTISSPTLLKS